MAFGVSSGSAISTGVFSGSFSTVGSAVFDIPFVSSFSSRSFEGSSSAETSRRGFSGTTSTKILGYFLENKLFVKIEIFGKYQIFRHKSKFSAKNINFLQKSKLSAKIDHVS